MFIRSTDVCGTTYNIYVCVYSEGKTTTVIGDAYELYISPADGMKNHAQFVLLILSTIHLFICKQSIYRDQYIVTSNH